MDGHLSCQANTVRTPELCPTPSASPAPPMGGPDGPGGLGAPLDIPGSQLAVELLLKRSQVRDT